jgi:DNA integrity scanning protein DisA with diadenylate cyclase activity
MYSQLFCGRKFVTIAPQLVCNAAGLDGAIVVDPAGIVRGIGCIFTASGVQKTTEGARTKAALFASKVGVALKLSQDGEVSLYRDSNLKFTGFSPTW